MIGQKDVFDAVILSLINQLHQCNLNLELLKNMRSEQMFDTETYINLVQSIAIPGPIHALSMTLGAAGLLGDPEAIKLYKRICRYLNMVENMDVFSSIGIKDETNHEPSERVAIFDAITEYARERSLSRDELEQHPLRKIFREVSP